MLKSLTIQNYVLIDHLELDFTSGFSVITGETGAGKSILLGALGLLLGDRADLSAIGNKEQKCFVEGLFDISSVGLEPFFDENDLEYEPESVIRRMLLPGGKSRAFINDMPVNLEVLRRLAPFLIDIHSQHQNQRLKDPLFPLEVVDALAKNADLRQEYKSDFLAYKEGQKALEELRTTRDQEKLNLDFYQHQLYQL